MKHHLKMNKSVVSLGLIPLITIPLIGICLTSTSCSSSEQYVDIVSLNDFHGTLGQTVDGAVDNRAPVIEQVADKYAEIEHEDQINNNADNSTYFVLNGDNSQGSALSNLSNPSGKATYDILKNVFAPEYSSVGNHEFDWGQGFLDPTQTPTGGETFQDMGLLKDFLACNIYQDQQGTKDPKQLVSWAQPYAITNINGINVGLVGYTTTSTPTTTTESNVSGLTFASASDTSSSIYPDPYTTNGDNLTGQEVVQKAIDACWNDSLNLNQGVKPDAVILLAHAGATLNSDGSLDTSSEIYQVINHIDHIDACISGHSHLNYVTNIKDKDNKKIYCGQADRYGNALLSTRIYYKKSNHKDIHIGMSYRKIDNNLTVDQLPYKNSHCVKTAIRSYDYWYKQMDDKISEPRFNVISNDTTTIVKENDDDNTSPAGLLFTTAMYKTLCPNSLSSVTDLSNVIDEVKSAQSEWNDFDGVDLAINNKGMIRNDLIPTGEVQNETSNSATTQNLFDVVPFDNCATICKLTAGNINDYFNKFYANKQNIGIIDPIASDTYKLGYKGNSLKEATEFELVDNNNNPVDTSTPLYVAINLFFYQNGDNSSWQTDSNDKYVIPSAMASWYSSGTQVPFDIYTDQRAMTIEYAYICATGLGDNFPTIDMTQHATDHWQYNIDEYYYHIV